MLAKEKETYMPKILTPEEKEMSRIRKNQRVSGFIKERYNVVYVRYKKEDEEITRKLDSVKSKSQYIVDLIKKDIAKEKEDTK